VTKVIQLDDKNHLNRFQKSIHLILGLKLL